MLENTTRVAIENLARAVNRRSFLKRAGEATFMALAAAAAGHSISAYADGKQQPNIVCNPPGPYCRVNGVATDGCHGASCFQHIISGLVYQCRVLPIWLRDEHCGRRLLDLLRLRMPEQQRTAHWDLRLRAVFDKPRTSA